MKKNRNALFAIMLGSCMCFSMCSPVIMPVSAATSSTNHANHAVSCEITKEATCTEDGELTEYCSCGQTTVTVIPATGHDYKPTSAVGADCTTKGRYVYTCQNCGDTYEETIPMEDHKYVDHVCSYCHDVELLESLVEQTGLDEDTVQKYIDSDEDNAEMLEEFIGNWCSVSKIGTDYNTITSNGSHSIRFQWSDVDNAAGYCYEIATDEDFTNIVKSGTVTTRTNFTASIKGYPDDDLYVRVRSYTKIKINGKSYKIYSKYTKAKKYAIADADGYVATTATTETAAATTETIEDDVVMPTLGGSSGSTGSSSGSSSSFSSLFSTFKNMFSK